MCDVATIEFGRDIMLDMKSVIKSEGKEKTTMSQLALAVVMITMYQLMRL